MRVNRGRDGTCWMGYLKVSMDAIYADLNLSGASASDTLRCLIDTGATFTKIPQALGQRLGLEIVREVS